MLTPLVLAVASILAMTLTSYVPTAVEAAWTQDGWGSFDALFPRVIGGTRYDDNCPPSPTGGLADALVDSYDDPTATRWKIAEWREDVIVLDVRHTMVVTLWCQDVDADPATPGRQYDAAAGAVPFYRSSIRTVSLLPQPDLPPIVVEGPLSGAT